MSEPVAGLPWLPRAPDDFSQQLKSAAAHELRKLASYSLDNNQLVRLAKRIASSSGDNLGLDSYGLGIVSSATTELLTPALVGTAARFGFNLRVVPTGFNQAAQEGFGQSALATQKLDAVLVAIDHRGLPLRASVGDLTQADATVAACASHLSAVVNGIRASTGALIVLQNIVAPYEPLGGSIERRLPGTIAWLIERINREIDAFATEGVVLFDAAGLAASVGIARWHDPVLWNMAKIPFAPEFAPLYADHVCRIIAASRGRSRRCLILDLDNTLWGGVIGDDGLDGIVIGQGDPTGEAHLTLQRTALDLRERGIVLAVCSKNDDAIARQAFHDHPDMLLREEHIAVFQANWTDKATNIYAIARALSLGLESMVFVDDNPAERMQVRRELPEVAVPELPADPAMFSRVLVAAGYFEAIALSAEDLGRAALYQQNARRVQLQNVASNMEEYLRSLNMEISFAPFDSIGRARIAQLVAKSNQFNLTTRRYTESQIGDLERCETAFTRQVRLRDVLGDNGMVSVIICRTRDDVWEIDTWLMSCRVLGRKVEEAVLQEIVREARKSGAARLIGRYIPTARNALVKDHYRQLGFTCVTREESGEEVWELELAAVSRPDVPMTVRHAF